MRPNSFNIFTDSLILPHILVVTAQSKYKMIFLIAAAVFPNVTNQIMCMICKKFKLTNKYNWWWSDLLLPVIPKEKVLCKQHVYGWFLSHLVIRCCDGAEILTWTDFCQAPLNIYTIRLYQSGVWMIVQYYVAMRDRNSKLFENRAV